MLTAVPTSLTDGAVLLRPLTPDDVPAITAHCQDPEIPRWTLVPSPYERRHAEEFLASGEWALAVCLASDGDSLLGCIGVPRVDEAAATAEVGYWIAAAARGRGLAPAALRLVTAWLVQHAGFRRVELSIFPGNSASERVAAKAGFRFEGVSASRHVRDGRALAAVVWAVTAEQVSPR